MSTILSILAFLAIQILLVKLAMGKPEPARDVQSTHEKDFFWISARRG
jgi:hypothetical protein